MTPLFEAERAFSGGTIPSWLFRFAEEPMEALDGLLFGTANLGPLGAARPAEVLLDWLAGLGDRGGFETAVDSALAEWVTARWRTFEHDGLPVVATTLAWCAVGEVLLVANLPQAAAALRDRVVDGPAFLGALAEGRARDPLFNAWLAVTAWQQDDELVERWWRWCRLDAQDSWYRGEIGVWGIARAPDLADREQAIANALALWATSLAARCESGWLARADVAPDVPRLGRLIQRALPAAMGWKAAFDAAPFPEPAVWLAGLTGQVRRPPSRYLDFPDRADRISARLRQPNAVVIREAQELIDDTRRYAEQTGTTLFFIKSSCRLAGLLPESELARAREWLAAVRGIAPSNEYGWSQGILVATRLGAHAEAESLGAEAVRRFPRNAVAAQSYAEALRAAGDWDRAIDAYRGVVGRFPGPQSVVGLAATLRDAGRLDEAEHVARRAVDAYPYDPAGWDVLAKVLHSTRRTREAQDVLANGIRAVGNTAEFENLARTLARPPRHWDAPSPVAAAAPTTLAPLLADASLLRAWIGREELVPGTTPAMWRARAEALLMAVATWSDAEPAASSEQGLLSMSLGDWESALRLLRRARERFPGSARVLVALAQAERHAKAGQQLWRSLSRLDPRLTPVQHLGQARLSATGDRAALGHLAWALDADRERGEDDAQWAADVKRAVFGEANPRGEGDIGDVAPILVRMRTNARALDELELERTERYAGA